MDGTSADAGWAAANATSSYYLDYDTRVSFAAPGGMFVILMVVGLWRLLVHWPPSCSLKSWSPKFFFHLLVVLFAVRAGGWLGVGPACVWGKGGVRGNWSLGRVAGGCFLSPSPFFNDRAANSPLPRHGFVCALFAKAPLCEHWVVP
jgi:hypothetical protein